MCFDLDSHPPIPPIAGAAVDGKRISLRASDGAEFAAYAAQPDVANGAGMIILPDVRGVHPFFEELALRFAEAGVEAVSVDYFGRTARDYNRREGFEYMPHVNQTHYDTLLLDTQAARDYLVEERGARSIFTVGFCFGGRLAFLTATRPELDLAGSIGFYGVVAGVTRAEMPAPLDVAGSFRNPVLGLFGGDDPSIPVDSIDAFRSALDEAGVENELVVYDGAPHSFFDRKADQYAAESADSWRRVKAFVERYAA